MNKMVELKEMFFEVREKLPKKSKNKKVAGVLGGIAEHFKISTKLLRGVVIALLLVTNETIVGTIVCGYFAAAVLMPTS